jgi:4a-hydroxytetrahydrobiopterin dehydratase
LSDSQRRQLLESLLNTGWSNQNSGRDCIQKTYEFLDFNEAFGFMNRIALKAEAIHRFDKLLA